MIDATDGMQVEWLEVHQLAVSLFTATTTHLHDFSAPTGCADWDVTELLRHVVAEQMWVPGLVAGGTLEEVADDLERPLRRLSEQTAAELLHTWSTLVDPIAATWRGTRLDYPVQLSYGQATVRHYLAQQTTDIAIHSWDLGVGHHIALEWDPALARAVADFVRTDLAGDPAPELFNPPVAGVSAGQGSDRKVALQLTGRDPSRFQLRSPR